MNLRNEDLHEYVSDRQSEHPQLTRRKRIWLFFALFCDVLCSPFEQTNAKSSVELGKAAKFTTDSECL